MDEEERKTYVLSVHYSDDRDTEQIESLSKDIAKQLVQSIKNQIDQKKEFIAIEVDEQDFYMFRLFNNANILSIDVDEE